MAGKSGEEEESICFGNLTASMLNSLTSFTTETTIHARYSSIHRVPPNIRQCDATSYEPHILSIGPYHHGKQHLQAMEEHKWRYLRNILDRNLQALAADPSQELEKLIRIARQVEPEARCYYSDHIRLIGDEMVKMMVLDACFMVELFIRFYRREKEDPLFAVPWILPLIRRDLLKLENQIPFFFLQRVFDAIKKPLFRSRSGEMLEFPTLREIAFSYLTWKKCNKASELSRLEVHHLLHLYDLILLPAPTSEPPGSARKPSKLEKSNVLPLCRLQRVSDRFGSHKLDSPSGDEWPTSTTPCAAEMRDAGIRFKVKKSAESFLDVEFRDGVLHMPCVSVMDATNSIFRNLIALEQCCPDAICPSKHFTSYALLMDCLINTPQDVAILKEHGIIENKLGSDKEVALLLNQLCKEVIIPYKSHYFAKLFVRVNKYCGSNWNKNHAMLRRDYFSNPWTSISVTAASILLALTFLQVVYAGLSYSCTKR